MAAAITLHPSSTAVREFAAYGASEWIQSIFVLLPILAIACWPWFVALLSASKHWLQTVIFSTGVAALAVGFYPSIMAGPPEGIGYSIIIYILIVWVTYPLSLLLRSIPFGK
jgi:hypothetical protein